VFISDTPVLPEKKSRRSQCKGMGSSKAFTQLRENGPTLKRTMCQQLIARQVAAEVKQRLATPHVLIVAHVDQSTIYFQSSATI
jgi:hypothetical protein